MSEKDPSFWFWVTSFSTAIISSLLAYFHSLKKMNASFVWLDFILRTSTGAVVGLLATAFALSFDYNQYFAGAIAGVAGMYSEQIVKWLEKFIDAWFGNHIDKGK